MSGGRILQREHLREFKTWFKEYVKNFYSRDPKLQAGIKLKESHTQRVCENMVLIGQSLDLIEEDLYLAETIALFHDIGRFKQYTIYKTFSDRHSENHALLGLKELEQAGVLSTIAETEKNLVTKAIENHNMKELPANTTDRCLLFSRMVRDADKLDILKVFTEYYSSGKTGFNPALESGLPDTPGYSLALVDDLLHMRNCNYSGMKNYNDRKLLLLSWIYDINFTCTLSEIAGKGYIEKIIESLPRTKEILTIHEHLYSYINSLQQRAGIKCKFVSARIPVRKGGLSSLPKVLP